VSLRRRVAAPSRYIVRAPEPQPVGPAHAEDEPAVEHDEVFAAAGQDRGRRTSTAWRSIRYRQGRSSHPAERAGCRRAGRCERCRRRACVRSGAQFHGQALAHARLPQPIELWEVVSMKPLSDSVSSRLRVIRKLSSGPASHSAPQSQGADGRHPAGGTAKARSCSMRPCSADQLASQARYRAGDMLR